MCIFTEGILTCHRKKSTGVDDKTNTLAAIGTLEYTIFITITGQMSALKKNYIDRYKHIFNITIYYQYRTLKLVIM